MIETVLIYGLVNSVTLILTAIGFSLTFGLSGIANFSHGGLYILSGYSAWMMMHYIGLPFALAAVLTVIQVGILGGLIYRAVIMPVRGIVLSEVVATFAVGVAILEFFRWRGFVTYDFNLPLFIKGSIGIAGVFIDYQRLFIIGIGLMLAVILWFFTHHTRIGLALRGMAQDEYTALSLGIESDWAATLSMALGAALAAVAAIIILPLGIISINMGYDVLLLALAVTILGGLESTNGLIVGCFILGYARVITGTYLGPEWMEVIYLAAIVLVLVVKPSGLCGKSKELEERV
ncbi:MAG: branched-chain amino acid ABC transporter permease [Peptococcaceae bacterium BRH_c8a]|nr:MAG: branched-chain amino acid ABC transporter permease [Peptococcaceae bacterium BRH_c8a]